MGTITSTPSLPSGVPSGAPLSTLTFFLRAVNVMEMSIKILVLPSFLSLINNNIVDLIEINSYIFKLKCNFCVFIFLSFILSVH